MSESEKWNRGSWISRGWREPLGVEDILEMNIDTIFSFHFPLLQVLLQHGYPEISSCGRRVDYPLHFSYIAGCGLPFPCETRRRGEGGNRGRETTCTLAKRFTCFVFEAKTDEQSRGILKVSLEAVHPSFSKSNFIKEPTRVPSTMN